MKGKTGVENRLDQDCSYSMPTTQNLPFLKSVIMAYKKGLKKSLKIYNLEKKKDWQGNTGIQVTDQGNDTSGVKKN